MLIKYHCELRTIAMIIKALMCRCLGGAGPNCIGLSIHYTAYMTPATHIYASTGRDSN